MIAARDEVDAAFEHFFGGLRGQAETARGVFAVGDAGIDSVLLARQRHTALEGIATRRTDDVADEQEVSLLRLSPRRRLGFLTRL